MRGSDQRVNLNGEELETKSRTAGTNFACSTHLPGREVSRQEAQGERLLCPKSTSCVVFRTLRDSSRLRVLNCTRDWRYHQEHIYEKADTSISFCKNFRRNYSYTGIDHDASHYCGFR